MFVAWGELSKDISKVSKDMFNNLLYRIRIMLVIVGNMSEAHKLNPLNVLLRILSNIVLIKYNEPSPWLKLCAPFVVAFDKRRKPK